MLVTLNHQIQHGLFTLQLLDLAAPAAAPIVTMLKDIPSTLQFMLEHSLMHMECLGSTTGAMISVSEAQLDFQSKCWTNCLQLANLDQACGCCVSVGSSI